MATPIFDNIFEAEDVKGRPVPFGRVYTYEPGTTTPKVTYSDEAGTVPNSNPVILDSSGKALIYGDGEYTINVKTLFDQQVPGWPRNIWSKANSSESIRPIPTIAKLRLTTGSFSGQNVQVSGYYTAGDGGGGPLRYWSDGQPPGTYIDNGGSIIVPTGGDGSAAWLVEDSSQMTILEWGGSDDGTTDNAPFIENWISSNPSSGILFFPDFNGSVYALGSKPSGGGPGYIYRFQGSATWDSFTNEPDGTTEFNYNNLAPETSYKFTRTIGDSVDQKAIPGGSKVNGNKTTLIFGGANATGGRHAIYGVLNQEQETASTNTDRNYVGVVGQAIGSSTTGDGGTDLATGAKGALFAANFIAVAQDGYTNTLNITGGEFNTELQTGCSTRLHSLCQLVTNDKVQGAVVDTGLLISGISGAIGLKHGIVFTDTNGQSPFDSVNGTIIGAISALGTLSVYRGIDFSDCTISNNVFTSKQFVINSVGGAEFGNASDAQVITLDLRSSGAGSDYDGRISCSGGSATAGQGVLSYLGIVHVFNNTLRPSIDNTISLGNGTFRWSEVFAGNGTINTSDENEKQQVEDIPIEWINAAKNIKAKRFKFNDAVEKKGSSARWHVGYIAQEVFQALFEAGVQDPFECSFLCKDTLYKDDKNIIPLIDKQTGKQKERWGIRYSELLSLKLAAIENI